MTSRELPDRPELLDLLPNEDDIDIAELGHGGSITTDTCNAARKMRRLLASVIESKQGTVYEQDCFHHLRCLWVNGSVKAITAYMSSFLEDSLDEISNFLRVSPDFSDVIRAFHKEFSLTKNYPKGHGEMFLDWVIRNHPNEFLLHCERASGNRQDLVCMGADAIYNNRHVCVESWTSV